MAPRSVLAIGGNRFPFHRFEERGPEIADAFDDRKPDAEQIAVH